MAYETVSDHTEIYNLGQKLYLAGKKSLCILDLDFYTSPMQQLGIMSWAECLTPHNVNITLKL